MQALLMKLLISFGFQLLREHIADDSDTSDIEGKLITAKTKEEVVTIAKDEAIRAIDEAVLKDTEIPDEVVDGLANANNTEEVIEVLESPAGQQTMFDVMGEAVSYLGSLWAGLFGQKK